MSTYFIYPLFTAYTINTVYYTKDSAAERNTHTLRLKLFDQILLLGPSTTTGRSIRESSTRVKACYGAEAA